MNRSRFCRTARRVNILLALRLTPCQLNSRLDERFGTAIGAAGTRKRSRCPRCPRRLLSQDGPSPVCSLLSLAPDPNQPHPTIYRCNSQAPWRRGAEVSSHLFWRGEAESCRVSGFRRVSPISSRARGNTFFKKPSKFTPHYVGRAVANPVKPESRQLPAIL